MGDADPNMKDRDWHALNEKIIHCVLCPRLTSYRQSVALHPRAAYRDQIYWARPVPGFGDKEARVVVVGLAPGAHGSNRTGRMFTGDSSGDFLYRALYRQGFANHPVSRSRDDGLALDDVFITSACRCAPPDNKPTIDEMTTCRPYLEQEFELLKNIQGFVALGQIGFDAILRVFRSRGWDAPSLKFAHAAEYNLDHKGYWLIASYHPSRQNTQTGRLTEEMFDLVWRRVRKLLPDEK